MDKICPITNMNIKADIPRDLSYATTKAAQRLDELRESIQRCRLQRDVIMSRLTNMSVDLSRNTNYPNGCQAPVNANKIPDGVCALAEIDEEIERLTDTVKGYIRPITEDRARSVMLMWYVDGLRPEVIAHLLGMSRMTVYRVRYKAIVRAEEYY